MSADKLRHLNKLKFSLYLHQISSRLWRNQEVLHKSFIYIFLSFPIPGCIQIYSKKSSPKIKQRHETISRISILLLFIANALWKWECKGTHNFYRMLRKNEPASKWSWVGDFESRLERWYEVAKSNDDDVERKDSRALSFILSVFMCFSPLFKKWWRWVSVWQMHTQKKNYIFFSPSLPTVVAQSYKIDVEILAAPRGT